MNRVKLSGFYQTKENYSSYLLCKSLDDIFAESYTPGEYIDAYVFPMISMNTNLKDDIVLRHNRKKYKHYLEALWERELETVDNEETDLDLCIDPGRFTEHLLEDDSSLLMHTQLKFTGDSFVFQSC